MHFSKLKNSVLLSAALAMVGCTAQKPVDSNPVAAATSTDELRDIRHAEAAADFRQMVRAFDALYGPLQRKMDRYGLTLTDLQDEGLRRLYPNIDESSTFRVMSRFLDAFHDAHVSYSPSLFADSARQVAIPLLVAPIEGRFLTYAVGGALAQQVARGDELVRIDGLTPQMLVRRFEKFESAPNPKTVEQLTALQVTFRSFLLPANFLPVPGTNATLEFARADGTRYTVAVPWASNRPPPRLSPGPSTPAQLAVRPTALASDAFQDVARAQFGLAQAGSVGSNRPFFLTNAVAQTYGITPIRPSAQTLSQFGVPLCEGSPQPTYDCYRSFAGTYTFEGKRILLVRIPSYVPSAAPEVANDSGYIKAILKDFQASSDVLVIDETNNPGGQVFFAIDVFSALITAPAINAGLAFHADRRSINTFRAAADFFSALGPQYAVLAQKYQGQASAIELAYDNKKPLGPLFPAVFTSLDGDERIAPDPLVQWAKPIVVLANELSFSGGDMFPMIVKSNRRGTVFGQTTAGAGGSVEEVLTTTSTQGSLRLTRSFFAPMDQASQIPFGNLVEDQGVAPDVSHELTVADFRAGYVDYVGHFSRTAVGLVAP